MILYVAALLAVFLAALIVYGRWNYGFLESTGIPVVPPKFLLGSDPDMHKIILHEVDQERGKKYGKFWGQYEGRAPHVYVTDVDLIRLILVKEFENFRVRRNIDFGHELFFQTLDVLPYDKWKAMRSTLSPAFSTTKIRLMASKIKEAADDCVRNIHKECGSAESAELNAKKIFLALATDIIARVAFAIKLDSLNDPENQFVQMLSILNGDEYEPNILLAGVLTFPFLSRVRPLFPTYAIEYFGNIVKRVLRSRRQTETNENDMVDAFNEIVRKISTPEFQRLGITETTAVAQAMNFLFAGFETIATTLTMLSYRLASNPDKQDKLIAELDELLGRKDGNIDHDDLRDLPYMNACINETLRINSVVVREERVCQKDWRHEESGLFIRKGTVVMIPNYCVHNNEKYWPEPDRFLPERFLPENKDKINQYAFLGFGHGPRNCIGMRMAREELNLAVASILKDFRVELTPETKLKFKPGRFFVMQYEPVQLRFVKRSRLA